MSKRIWSFGKVKMHHRQWVYIYQICCSNLVQSPGLVLRPLPISFLLLFEDLLEVLPAGQSLIHHTGTLLSSLKALKSEVWKLTINFYFFNYNNILNIWKVLWAGEMNQILYCDWLPIQAQWHYLTSPGLPNVSQRKMSP